MFSYATGVCSGPPMKNGRQNSEGFVGHSVVSYGPSLTFGGNYQFNWPPGICWSELRPNFKILDDFFLRKHQFPSKQKTGNMDQQSKYDHEETKSTSDVESCTN